MFAKSWIEIEILENLRKPLTRKSTHKRIDIDFQRVSFIRALWDSRKIHCLMSEFHIKFYLENRYRTHRFAIHAISVFRVEFTHQAVNFSIKLQWFRSSNPRILIQKKNLP